jgi:hypothetical protein
MVQELYISLAPMLGESGRLEEFQVIPGGTSGQKLLAEDL